MYNNFSPKAKNISTILLLILMIYFVKRISVPFFENYKEKAKIQPYVVNSQQPTGLTSSTHNYFRKGTKVILRGSSGSDTGLWLFYGSMRDVVRYWVPRGTPATLSGRVCDDHGRYYQVEISRNKKVKLDAEIFGSDLWVNEDDIELSK